MSVSVYVFGCVDACVDVNGACEPGVCDCDWWCVDVCGVRL